MRAVGEVLPAAVLIRISHVDRAARALARSITGELKMNDAIHDVHGVALPRGTDVEVRGRFDGRWVGGFEIASTHDDQYQIRRQMDDVVIPVDFAVADIRRRT